MPTHEEDARFTRDWRSLTREQRARFLAALPAFIAGVRAQRFDNGLRVKAVEGSRGVWEMTWAPDGRATFVYGPSKNPADPHIIWRRVGTHDIFREP